MVNIAPYTDFEQVEEYSSVVGVPILKNLAPAGFYAAAYSMNSDKRRTLDDLKMKLQTSIDRIDG
jgi:hypothetical protein